MSRAAIHVEGIGKLYQLSHYVNRHATFRDAITAMALAPFRRFRELRGTEASMEDFWALKDVNFAIEAGEVVGIVGRNGAGKSTLLKVLSRIVEPTVGQAVLHGRVASLLEVGTGFHPELTGRENIYLNGSILGMKKREISSKFDEIVAFAEVERFLDTPVKRYSSGMYVRLAFAVAAHLEPEILIVDEVLSVGDAEFQKKCIGKMREVATGGGRTVLFVSHNMAAVSTLCNRALLLEKGTLVADDSTDQVLERYLAPSAGELSGIYDLRHTKSRASGFKPIIVGVRVFDESGRLTVAVAPLQELQVEIDLDPAVNMKTPMVDIGFNNARGERIFAVGSYFSPTPLGQANGLTTFKASFKVPPLYPGRYEFDIAVMPVSGRYTDHVTPAGAIEVLPDNYLGTSYPFFPEMGSVLVPSRWDTIENRATSSIGSPLNAGLS